MPRCKFALIPTRPVPLVTGNVLDFDATTKQDVQSSGSAIQHPKESALEPLTDDVYLDPDRIAVTAHFVDFPLYYGTQIPPFAGRAKLLADSVRLLREKKIPCIVLMGDDVFLSMVITSIGTPRGVDTGGAVDMDIELNHIEMGEIPGIDAIIDAASQALGAEPPVVIGLKP